MKGLVDFLISDSPLSKTLRSHYVFRIVPMLNPDGIIYGNYRCSLLGYDLNRHWKNPDKILQPTIFHAKELVRAMNEEREVSLFCDLHGHSTQSSVFMYGCSWGVSESEWLEKSAGVRLVPLLMAQMNSKFSYALSRFSMEKSKESTARIVVFKEFGVKNSYTCEASFLGYLPDLINRGNVKEYERIGECLCKVAMMYIPEDKLKQKCREIIRGIEAILKEKYAKYIAGNADKSFGKESTYMLHHDEITEDLLKDVEVKNIVNEVGREIFPQEKLEESDNDISDDGFDESSDEHLIEKVILRSQKMKKRIEEKAIPEEMKRKASAPFIKPSAMQKQPIKNCLPRNQFNTQMKQMTRASKAIGSFVTSGNRMSTRKPMECKWQQLEFNSNLNESKTEKKASRILKVSLEGFKMRNFPSVKPSCNIKCTVAAPLDRIMAEYSLNKVPVPGEKQHNAPVLKSWVTRIVRDRLIFMHNRVLVTDSKCSRQLKMKSFKSSMESERMKTGLPEYSCEEIRVRGNRLDRRLQQSRRTHELRRGKVITDGRYDKALSHETISS
eukprot:TRINITY_DN560_c0_g5_i2.p1 TRINITY_DN560_c0_g5~~TRINITY_DN560_c0_g5_i2.p1  ORF type:complete len:555 (+),score=127.52 TRINITY_DN560_c0_g5_i2:321-1985(+)